MAETGGMPMATAKATPNVSRLLRLRDVEQRTGLKRTTIYSLVACGQFPRPVKVGPRASAWVESELTTWIGSRIAARDARRRA